MSTARTAAKPPAATGSLAAEHPAAAAKKSGEKRFTQRLIWQLCAGWLLLLGLIVVGARWLWEDTSPLGPAAKPAAEEAPAATPEDLMLLAEAVPQCAATFANFLTAGTPEGRNQFVLTPVATAARMARYYSQNPLLNINPNNLTLTDQAVLKLPGGQAIETFWLGKDGKKIDAVFRQENGEWRLDWDHYTRYSDYPWSLFLAGSGSSEGEFRLLARPRLADEQKDSNTISVVFYAPRFAHPDEAGFQSPPLLIVKQSTVGRMLEAAFKLAASGHQVFGSQLPNPNPEGMIRVRVKVRRNEVAEERHFEITEVLACHWYSVNDPGVEPAATVINP